ncbi:antitoxin ParD1/3/4 [Rhizobium petrolearium]|uniref:ribbon-helix-helix domain-containing protein n=1 Tax=Neorhizobium petrolearium TaxID=515361 RepID=UPI001AE3C538|nr:type II toxin-antitoxin system ParD family antitoxin [Neorhizobium petrolearium]MBP1843206.1 antitoxin ParD1/3/4 [Neorhizobium petrolearium]
MSVKASVSISDQQDLFARKLVEEGRFSSLSAVVQRGLELVREETELKDAELAALKKLIDDRMDDEFVTIEESDKQIAAMIAEKKAALGL